MKGKIYYRLNYTEENAYLPEKQDYNGGLLGICFIENGQEIYLNIYESIQKCTVAVTVNFEVIGNRELVDISKDKINVLKKIAQRQKKKATFFTSDPEQDFEVPEECVEFMKDRMSLHNTINTEPNCDNRAPRL